MMYEMSSTGPLGSFFKDRPVEDDEVYRIGDLAREFGITLRALRFYEDRGLLSPKRSGSTRLYNGADRERLKMILLAKRANFSLVEIREILEILDKSDSSDDMLDEILSRFEKQTGVLRQQRDEMDKTIQDIETAVEQLRSQHS